VCVAPAVVSEHVSEGRVAAQLSSRGGPALTEAACAVTDARTGLPAFLHKDVVKRTSRQHPAIAPGHQRPTNFGFLQQT
jgi:hypothetical protein